MQTQQQSLVFLNFLFDFSEFINFEWGIVLHIYICDNAISIGFDLIEWD